MITYKYNISCNVGKIRMFYELWTQSWAVSQYYTVDEEKQNLKMTKIFSWISFRCSYHYKHIDFLHLKNKKHSIPT